MNGNLCSYVRPCSICDDSACVIHTMKLKNAMHYEGEDTVGDAQRDPDAY